MITPLLLRPYFLGAWNDLRREYKAKLWNRTTFAILFMLFILSGMYLVSVSFFLKFKEHEVFSPQLLGNFISLSLLGIFSVTCFSAIISAMGALFSSKDISLFFVAPVSLTQIFIAKLIHITCMSTWMFALVAIVFSAGLLDAFGLSCSVLPIWIAHFILFLTIPSNIGIVLVIIVANIVPAERLREVLVLFVILGLVFLLAYEQDTTLSTSVSDSISRAVILSKKFSVGNNPWLPHSLLSSVISNSFTGAPFSWQTSFLLLTYSIGSSLISLFLFTLLFLRGWARSSNSNVQRVIYQSQLSTKIGDYLFHQPSPLRAFLGKELRTFTRDTTQSIQFLLLITLTFIYIYNFRMIQSGAIIEEQYREIWQAILSCSNILFGGFVIAAICTRFVFPTISLEGASYQILRATPISLREFVRFKYLTWYIPLSIVSFLLFASGALSIEVDTYSFITTAIISFSMSASLVALGIGTGAIYSRFDWENPIQVSSSFGSLVYMFLSMGLICVNLIPVSILFLFLNLGVLKNSLLFVDLAFVYICCIFLIIILNGSIIRRSLLAAEQHLENTEN